MTNKSKSLPDTGERVINVDLVHPKYDSPLVFNVTIHNNKGIHQFGLTRSEAIKLMGELHKEIIKELEYATTQKEIDDKANST